MIFFSSCIGHSSRSFYLGVHGPASFVAVRSEALPCSLRVSELKSSASRAHAECPDNRPGATDDLPGGRTFARPLDERAVGRADGRSLAGAVRRAHGRSARNYLREPLRRARRSPSLRPSNNGTEVDRPPHEGAVGARKALGEPLRPDGRAPPVTGLCREFAPNSQGANVHEAA